MSNHFTNSLPSADQADDTPYSNISRKYLSDRSKPWVGWSPEEMHLLYLAIQSSPEKFRTSPYKLKAAANLDKKSVIDIKLILDQLRAHGARKAEKSQSSLQFKNRRLNNWNYLLEALSLRENEISLIHLLAQSLEGSEEGGFNVTSEEHIIAALVDPSLPLPELSDSERQVFKSLLELLDTCVRRSIAHSISSSPSSSSSSPSTGTNDLRPTLSKRFLLLEKGLSSDPCLQLISPSDIRAFAHKALVSYATCADKLWEERPQVVGRPTAEVFHELSRRRAEYERLRALHSMNPLALSSHEILFNRALSSVSHRSPAVDSEEQEQLTAPKEKDLTTTSTSHDSQEAASPVATDAAQQPALQQSAAARLLSDEPVLPIWARKSRKVIRKATFPAARAALQSRLLQELVPQPVTGHTAADPLRWFHALRKRKLDWKI